MLISAIWFGDIRHRRLSRLFGHVARLDPIDKDDLHLLLDIPTKAEKAMASWVALATSSSTGFRGCQLSTAI